MLVLVHASNMKCSENTKSFNDGWIEKILKIVKINLLTHSLTTVTSPNKTVHGHHNKQLTGRMCLFGFRLVYALCTLVFLFIFNQVGCLLF